MGKIRRGAAVAVDAHGACAAGEHVFNGESSTCSDAVAVFFEVVFPAVINGEKQLYRAWDIHGAEYNWSLELA